MLAARGLLDGRATAGRGNTHFLRLDGHALVLRHYRRGGLVRHLTERRYVWTGVARTRAVREFELLRELERDGLPAPRPFACAVTRHGLLWSGSLVTYRLSGRTLAERVGAARGGHDDERPPASPSGTPIPWADIGRTIGRFHARGIRHADLNAHNVLIDGEVVHLIDFDRASHRSPSRGGPARWQRSNVERLRRSLRKLARTGAGSFDARGFAALEHAWRTALGAGR